MGFVVLCGAPLVLLIAAWLLRFAVSITNALVGPVKKRAPAIGGIAEWDWDDWDDEYAAEPAPAVRDGTAIPEPGVFKCVGIVFATALVAGFGFIVLLTAAGWMAGLRRHRTDTQLAVVLVDLPVASLVLTVLLVTIVPTTFWRAAMVTFFFNLLLIGSAIGLGTALYAITLL